MKEDEAEKLRLSKEKRMAKAAQSGKKIAASNHQDLSVRDHCQRAYQTN
jgi:hypothetical protein